MTASRFELLVPGKTDEDNPGPGQYETQRHNATGVGAKSGLMVTQEDRFKKDDNKVPGPGAYQLSPLQQHSVLQSTFNVTLNNPVSDNQMWHRNQGSPPQSRQTFMLGV